MENVNNKGRRLNWRQACDIMCCGKNYFYILVKKGELPLYRVKGKKRGGYVYEKDCLNLLQQINTNE